MFSLKNKIAVITGGGSGIGQAIALCFAKQGAIIHIIDIGSDVLNTPKNDKIKTHLHTCDVSNQVNVFSTFEKIGKFDILVNNAGIAHVGNIENTSEADLDRVISVNIKGVYNCTKAAIPFFKKQNSGIILNVASIAALVGIPDRFAYSMSKGAVLAMTLSTAKDYLPFGIRCNSISPARVHTPFVDGFIQKNYAGKETEMLEKLFKSQPIGRMGTPEEIAYLALYLCSHEASFITGCDYPIDGGFVKLNN